MLDESQKKILVDCMETYIQSQYHILSRLFEDLERIGSIQKKEQAIEQLSADLPSIVREFILILLNNQSMPFNTLQRAISRCVLTLMDSNKD